MLLTSTQLAVFRKFFADDLGGGALAFDWTDPVTGTAATFRFVGDGAPYRVRPAGANVQLTLSLEILP